MQKLLVLFFLILASCSPQKRFNRLIKKNPELIETKVITRIDTVKIHVPKIQHDTFLLDHYLNDTVYIEKERLKVKLWRVSDTIRINAECDSVTLTEYREVKIPVKYYEKTTFWDKIKGYLYFLLILCVIFAAYKAAKRFKIW